MVKTLVALFLIFPCFLKAQFFGIYRSASAEYIFLLPEPRDDKYRVVLSDTGHYVIRIFNHQRILADSVILPAKVVNLGGRPLRDGNRFLFTGIWIDSAGTNPHASYPAIFVCDTNYAFLSAKKLFPYSAPDRRCSDGLIKYANRYFVAVNSFSGMCSVNSRVYKLDPSFNVLDSSVVFYNQP